MTARTPRRALRRAGALLAAAIALPLALAGCSATAAASTLHVLAGSEVRDLEPLLDDMAAEIGVQLEFEYIGTLDGTEALLAGEDPRWDAIWFPSNRYLSLFPEGADLVQASESIMRSPVVLGLKAEAADALGWSEEAPPTWQEVVDAVERGALSYGMTSPVSSNSGFTTLVQLATAVSGTGTVLEAEDVAAAAGPLQTFAEGQELASGSSGWLVDRFMQDPTAVHGIFNYESVLEEIRVDGEPLTIIIPSDGVITSDYPFSLLAGADAETAERYDAAVEYLMREDVQERIAEETGRRTTATPPSMDAGVFELPFPNRLDTVQTLLETWVADVKKPSSMVFAIDTSGSMSGDRMAQLDEALEVLSGIGAEGTGAFLRLQPRERITFLEFADAIKSEETYDLPADPAALQSALEEIDGHIDGYEAGGGTSIYDTLAEAFAISAADAGSGTISSIVLFTDGESNEGMDAAGFEDWYAEFLDEHPEAAGIPVFAVQFGEANRAEMEHIAALTGGRLFDATAESLAAAFREIRGYL